MATQAANRNLQATTATGPTRAERRNFSPTDRAIFIPQISPFPTPDGDAILPDLCAGFCPRRPPNRRPKTAPNPIPDGVKF